MKRKLKLTEAKYAVVSISQRQTKFATLKTKASSQMDRRESMKQMIKSLPGMSNQNNDNKLRLSEFRTEEGLSIHLFNSQVRNKEVH